MTNWQTYKHGISVISMAVMASAIALGVAILPAGAIVFGIESYAGKALHDNGDFIWYVCAALIAPAFVGMVFKESYRTLLKGPDELE